MKKEIDDLQKNITEFQKKYASRFQDFTESLPQAENSVPNHDQSVSRIAFHAISELIAGIFVGALIGYTLDLWIASHPLCLILFLFLGFIASILNMYRTTHSVDNKKSPLMEEKSKTNS